MTQKTEQSPAPVRVKRTRAKGHIPNLRSHPEGLKRGGKKEQPLTIAELEYCNFRAQGLSIADSGRYSDLPNTTIYTVELRQPIRDMIDKMKSEYVQAIIDRTKRQTEELSTFVHGEFRHRMRTMVTHEVRGDADVVKALEVGFKAIGSIQPQQTINNATAGSSATASAGIFAKRLYLPDWRRETIEKLQNDEGRSSGAEVPNGTQLPAGQ